MKKFIDFLFVIEMAILMWIVMALYWLEQTLLSSLLMAEFLGLWVSAVIYLGLALRSHESSFRNSCFRGCRACCVGGSLFISNVAINDTIRIGLLVVSLIVLLAPAIADCYEKRREARTTSESI